jgi:hypothetical protein
LELLNNDTKHLDKADIFSLGCTCYELSTGAVSGRQTKLQETHILQHRQR